MTLENILIKKICGKCKLGEGAMEECIETKTCCPHFAETRDTLQAVIEKATDQKIEELI